MTANMIQDRTSEFRAAVSSAQKRQNVHHRKQANSSTPAQQQAQPLLNGHANNAASDRKQRTEFARTAAGISRSIASTTQKLQRLAELCRRKTLFDDRPVEIAELTYVIKQDLASLNTQIGQLQTLSKSNSATSNVGRGAEQEGEHNKNVVVLLQGKLADVSVNFKEVLEVRTKNIQASRSRTENFVSSVGSHSQPNSLDPSRTESPLYSTPKRGASPRPGSSRSGLGGGGGGGFSSGSDVLSLDPMGSSSSGKDILRGPQSQQQLQMMEEGSNSYIQERGQAIEAIERTIGELGSIFGQLAQMVSEQSEQIQRIDANTDDVVDNVEGAQRELLKYWSRISGNRWLVAKMFGVLMIFFLLWVLIN